MVQVQLSRVTSLTLYLYTFKQAAPNLAKTTPQRSGRRSEASFGVQATCRTAFPNPGQMKDFLVSHQPYWKVSINLLKVMFAYSSKPLKTLHKRTIGGKVFAA